MIKKLNNTSNIYISNQVQYLINIDSKVEKYQDSSSHNHNLTISLHKLKKWLYLKHFIKDCYRVVIKIFWNKKLWIWNKIILLSWCVMTAMDLKNFYPHTVLETDRHFLISHRKIPTTFWFKIYLFRLLQWRMKI